MRDALKRWLESLGDHVARHGWVDPTGLVAPFPPSTLPAPTPPATTPPATEDDRAELTSLAAS